MGAGNRKRDEVLSLPLRRVRSGGRGCPGSGDRWGLSLRALGVWQGHRSALQIPETEPKLSNGNEQEMADPGGGGSRCLSSTE